MGSEALWATTVDVPKFRCTETLNKANLDFEKSGKSLLVHVVMAEDFKMEAAEAQG